MVMLRGEHSTERGEGNLPGNRGRPLRCRQTGRHPRHHIQVPSAPENDGRSRRQIPPPPRLCQTSQAHGPERAPRHPGATGIDSQRKTGYVIIIKAHLLHSSSGSSGSCTGIRMWSLFDHSILTVADGSHKIELEW